MHLTLLGGGAASGSGSEWSADQKHPLGTLAFSNDGRWFRYAQAGALALVPGNLVQRPAAIADHLAMTPPVVPIGATSFLVTPGATAGIANYYAEGYLQVDTAPGNGYAYKVSGHPAIVAGTPFRLTLTPDDAIAVALTAISRIGLHSNMYRGVIQTPATLTGPVVGGVVAPVAALQYGWLQTRGPFPALIVGTPAVNAPVISSATVPGGADVWTATAQPTATAIGYMMQLGVGGKNNLVNLKID
jgi:hypothetical protein